MIQGLLGGLVVIFMLLLAVGAITGRVKARSCCNAGDPEHDRRMDGASTQSRTTTG